MLKYLKEQRIDFNQSEINLVAIEKNHLPALIKIIEMSENTQLLQLSMSIEMIYSCSYVMIVFLKEKGMHLNPWQEYCLKAKDSHVLSVLFSIYIYSLIMMRYFFGLKKTNDLYFDENIIHAPHPS
ncbi:MAG: hypothetical protein QG556_773 [Pseudomonadota bacterium]|nr:hypothetical protein [Pseudomonadota bacterium]